MGMRGKKSMPYESEDEESEMGPVAKRAGFVGMRGKKAGKGAQTAKNYRKPFDQTHRRKSYGIRKKDQGSGNRT